MSGPDSSQSLLDSSAARWQAQLLGLLHPAQIAVVEACRWIDEPLSATQLVRVLDGAYPLNTLAYHVRRLSEAGVLHEVDSVPRRGAMEHFHRLID